MLDRLDFRLRGLRPVKALCKWRINAILYCHLQLMLPEGGGGVACAITGLGPAVVTLGGCLVDSSSLEELKIRGEREASSDKERTSEI